MTSTPVCATLLFTILPGLDPAALAARLPGMRAETTGDQDRFLLQSDQARIHVILGPTPLGAQAFNGAIAPDTTPANRAALSGIVARHGAWVRIEVEHGTGTNPAKQELAYHCARALAALHTPLALHWGPTNRLIQRAGIEAFQAQDTPFELFLTTQDEMTSQRRTPALRIEGARPWLGFDLHAQLGALPREIVRCAALAFVRAARANAAIVNGQSFIHAGQSFRIAHAPDGGRVDLIPTAQAPLIVRPLPKGVRQAV